MMTIVKFPYDYETFITLLAFSFGKFQILSHKQFS